MGTYKKKLTETLKALAIRNGFANAFSVPTLFLLAYPGLRQPWAGISERLRRFGLHSNWTSTFALKLDRYLLHSNWTSAFSLKLDRVYCQTTGVMPLLPAGGGHAAGRIGAFPTYVGGGAVD